MYCQAFNHFFATSFINSIIQEHESNMYKEKEALPSPCGTTTMVAASYKDSVSNI